MRVATRDLGYSPEAQQTPGGRKPRKKVSLLICHNRDVSVGWRQRGISRVPAGLKIPLGRVSYLRLKGNVLIWTFQMSSINLTADNSGHNSTGKQPSVTLKEN